MSDLTGLSLGEYTQELQNNQRRAIQIESDNVWIESESRAIIRFPTFYDVSPNIADVHRALKMSKGVVASYIREPDDQFVANTWLYICQDRNYSLEKLSKNARRDVRRAQRELRITSVDFNTILEKGFQAFQDTRERVGLTDGTPSNFRSRMEHFAANKAHHFIGVWKDDKLVAFATLVIVNDWVEIEGSFSTNDERGSCPNNGLIHYILNHFLVENGFKTVSYGLSTVQQNSNESGLHTFKKRVHFEARPMCRIFVVRPCLRPFVNCVTLWGMEGALRLFPRNRQLKKAHGMMANILNKPGLPEIV